jgi:hypothetical protein
MSVTLQSPHLKSLLDFGLISEQQAHAAALHDDAAELDDEPDEIDTLYWLVTRGIVSEGELEAHKDRMLALPEASDADEARFAIVHPVLEMVDHVVKGMCRPEFEALLALGLIDATQFEASGDVRPQRGEGVIDTPARALAVLHNRGIVTDEQFEAMKTQAHADAPGAGEKERGAVVLEAEKIFNDMVGQYVSAMNSGMWRTFMLIMLFVAAVIGLGLWLG